MSFTGITEDDRIKMLREIGVGNIDELFSDIPPDILLENIDGLPGPLSELEVERCASSIKKKNAVYNRIYAGAGAYNHYIPSVVDEIASRSEFYTSYTPYQPEVSQGTLGAIFEFQTMMSRLNCMDITNASMYDGATSMAEAAMMAVRTNGRHKVLVSRSVHPNYREVLKTYSWAAGFDIDEIPLFEGVTDLKRCEEMADDTVSAIIVQSPNFFGLIENIESFSLVKDRSTLLIAVVVEALSLGLLRGAGELGADIVCGDVQSFGNYLNFGGPYAGYISAKKELIRRMPGRLVGQTVDSSGNRVYTLTLQTREQHIRREKATSNICTNEGLIALRAAVYLSLLGTRIHELAVLNHKLAGSMFERLKETGIETAHSKPFFNEFLVIPSDIKNVVKEFNFRGINPGIDITSFYPEYEGSLLVCVTETVTLNNINQYIEIIRAADGH